MQNIIFITQCTNRKKSTVDCVSKKDIPQNLSLNSTADLWVDEIENAKATMKVMDLYSGRGFSEFRQAVKQLHESDCFIISAGLGLVRGSDFVPNYNLTITNGTKNSILKNANFSALDWWQAINKRRNSTTTPVSDLILGRKFSLIVLGISKPYLSLISAELESLTEEQLTNTRLIGPVSNAGMSEKLKQILMPYNHNFDGPDSPNPGTKSDLAQRVFRHFIENVLSEDPTGSLSRHKKLVVQKMESMRPAKLQFDRQKLSDEEVVAKIEEFWDVCNGASGITLRYLRDQGFACEQSRFAQIFREVKKEKLQHD